MRTCWLVDLSGVWVRKFSFSRAQIRAVVAAFGASSVISCASSLPPTVMSGTPVSSHSRIADAVDKAVETPWPEIRVRSWGARVVGVVAADSNEFSRGDAIEFYVDQLATGTMPCDALMRDAIMQIAAAENLYREAAKVSEQSGATPRDVELMEMAISVLRESRSVYLGAIRKLDNVDEFDARATSDYVRREFGFLADRLADLADTMADNVIADQTRSYAGPERARNDGAL